MSDTINPIQLKDIIDAEGFDYTLRDYINPANISDDRLRHLVRKYIDAADAVEDYLESIPF